MNTKKLIIIGLVAILLLAVVTGFLLIGENNNQINSNNEPEEIIINTNNINDLNNFESTTPTEVLEFVTPRDEYLETLNQAIVFAWHDRVGENLFGPLSVRNQGTSRFKTFYDENENSFKLNLNEESYIDIQTKTYQSEISGDIITTSVTGLLIKTNGTDKQFETITTKVSYVKEGNDFLVDQIEIQASN